MDEIFPSHLKIPNFAAEEVDIVHTYSEVPDYITEKVVETLRLKQQTRNPTKKHMLMKHMIVRPN